MALAERSAALFGDAVQFFLQRQFVQLLKRQIHQQRNAGAQGHERTGKGFLAIFLMIKLRDLILGLKMEHVMELLKSLVPWSHKGK